MLFKESYFRLKHDFCVMDCYALSSDVHIQKYGTKSHVDDFQMRKLQETKLQRLILKCIDEWSKLKQLCANEKVSQETVQLRNKYKGIFKNRSFEQMYESEKLLRSGWIEEQP